MCTFCYLFFLATFWKRKIEKEDNSSDISCGTYFFGAIFKIAKKKIKIKKLLGSFGVYSILSPKYRKKEGNWFLTPSHPRWLCQGKGEYEKGDILVHFLKKYY